MRRLLCLIVLLALPGLAGAQSSDYIRYYPPAGLSQLSGTTAITSTVPILVPTGATPGLSFAGDPDTGIGIENANQLIMRAGGSRIGVFLNMQLRMNGTGQLSWASGDPDTTGADTILSRESAAVVQIGLDAATGTAQTIKAADSTGATITGASLTVKGGNGTSGIANGGALILAGGANSSTGEPGAVAIADGGTKPTCAAGIRGSIWYDAGGAGVADTFEVCAKAAAGDAYAWRILATIP